MNDHSIDQLQKRVVDLRKKNDSITNERKKKEEEYENLLKEKAKYRAMRKLISEDIEKSKQRKIKISNEVKIPFYKDFQISRHTRRGAIH